MVLADAVRRMDAAGIALSNLSLRRPSLDDVYLRYSGRRFTEADQSPAAPAASGGSK